MLVTQFCPTLCNPIDCSPPGSSVPGILQARRLEWVAISFSNVSFSSSSLVAKLCPTLCDPMDCSLPDSSVHGILQARRLEWVALPSPGNLSEPRIEPGLLHCRQMLYCLSYSVQFSRSVMNNSLRPHESQHARPPCPSPTPGVH